MKTIPNKIKTETGLDTEQILNPILIKGIHFPIGPAALSTNFSNI